MTDQSVTRWWWIRHAPVVEAHLGRLSGQANVDADISDRKSFMALAPDLPREAMWVLSTLKRTQQTAQALCRAGAQSSKAHVEKSFDEQAFGDWTNKSWDEVGSGAEAQEFWQDPAYVHPPGNGAESFGDVCRRV
ncbi:MAG: histidine phosphatase family protein, partial [Magnetovibrio sp.]|nr:histidine phosphatase family protein [Magnetovibrio sp.]